MQSNYDVDLLHLQQKTSERLLKNEYLPGKPLEPHPSWKFFKNYTQHETKSEHFPKYDLTAASHQ